jgi:hypothetical protein
MHPFSGRPVNPAVIVAALLALVPVLCVAVPGFSDAPAHMARHHILGTLPFGGPLSRYFVVHWQWIANLGEDIPAALIARWQGGEVATRIVTAAIAPLMILGLAALSRAAHGRVAASTLVASPIVFHQAWMYGFLNYCLGTALAFLVAAWLYARKPETILGQSALGLAALVVWTAHMASWAVLLVLAAGNAFGSMRTARDLMPEARRHSPLLLPLIPLTLWRSHSHGSDFSFVYDNFVLNKLAIFAGALRGTWMKADLGLLALVLLTAVLAVCWSARRRIEKRLFIAGSLLVLAAIAAPDYLLNSWGTDVRTAPIAIMVLILAIPPAQDPRRERIVCMIGLALFVARLTSVTLCWAQRSPMLEQRLAMLDAVPRGGRLGYLYAKTSCDGWKLTPDEKLGSYAVERRDAFVNTLFMVDNARLVTIRDPHLQARWTSESQRVKVECPDDRLDSASLRQSLYAMRQDGFDAIWVSGVARSDLPLPAGYRVVRSLPMETMLVRR